MSNSEVFVIKEDQEIKFEISKRLIRSEVEDKCHQEEANKLDHNDKSGTVNPPVKDEVVEVVHNEEDEEYDNGFKTPTSLDHKIPVEIECPPAPTKPKPSRKRKASSSSISNRPRVVRLLDLSRVVMSLYNPTEFQGKINYSRKDS